MEHSSIISHSAFLSQEDIREYLSKNLAGIFSGGKILVLIPDHTRSLPLPFLFRTLTEILPDTQQLDFMVALGTHPPLNDQQMNQLIGISKEERSSKFQGHTFLNHSWEDPSTLETIGILEQDEIKDLAGNLWHSSLPERIPIKINKAILDYDQILILGPTFPHEVVGFSGGAKYLFPGISGPEMINATHWLGALAGVVDTIGIKDTPVRSMIHAAADRVSTPITLAALATEGNDLSGIFIGHLEPAWQAAAEFSAQRHIIWSDKPYQRVLSCAPAMYDELWTAAKAMYKLEPVMAPGGEVVIYAPHLDTVSHVHGKYIREIGYHTLPYFLLHWEKYKHIPLGVLAHSTHLRGGGRMDGDIEKPNLQVTLSSKISEEDCTRLNLSYLDPQKVNPTKWKNQESKGILFVQKAGEMLYRTQNTDQGGTGEHPK